MELLSQNSQNSSLFVKKQLKKPLQIFELHKIGWNIILFIYNKFLYTV